MLAETQDLAPQAPPAPPTREQILHLQAAMLPVACPVPEAQHLFAPGMYLRRLEVPAGMVVVGKTHRHPNFFLVLKGRALVVSEHGRQEVCAGHIAVGAPGVKRVAVALEDTVFVNVHHNPTDTQDLAVIEAEQIDGDADRLVLEGLKAVP